jgi:CrcB protein
MMMYVWVAVGGALGSVARFWCSNLVARAVGETFPWGTLGVNVSGSFIIGLMAAVSSVDSRFLISPEARIFVMVGICGGYTTFSSFSLQTLNLLREHEWLAATGNVAGSVVLCMLAVWLGYAAGVLLSR